MSDLILISNISISLVCNNRDFVTIKMIDKNIDDSEHIEKLSIQNP